MMLVALLSLLIWIGLLAFREQFWLARDTDEAAVPDPAVWPAVTAVIPARDEADMIARSVGSLLRQDYPGRFSVVVVDDQSTDGTAAAALAAAGAAQAGDRLRIVTGAGPPPGWTGKLSAMRQGLAEVEYAFRPMKTTLLEMRGIFVRQAARTRAHVFVIMLA